MKFAQRLKQIMEQKPVTMYRLAKELNVHQTTIKNWLDGKGEPRLAQLQTLATALGTTVSELVDPDYWSTIPKEEVGEAWESNPPFYVKPEARVENAMSLMDKEGRCKVADYAEDILPRYRAETAPQAPSPPPKGIDTTPPENAPETLPEGE